jgi:hypothetical protein
MFVLKPLGAVAVHMLTAMALLHGGACGRCS